MPTCSSSATSGSTRSPVASSVRCRSTSCGTPASTCSSSTRPDVSRRPPSGAPSRRTSCPGWSSASRRRCSAASASTPASRWPRSPASALDEVRALWRALGFATVDDDERRVFTDADLEALRRRQAARVGRRDRRRGDARDDAHPRADVSRGSPRGRASWSSRSSRKHAGAAGGRRRPRRRTGRRPDPADRCGCTTTCGAGSSPPTSAASVPARPPTPSRHARRSASPTWPRSPRSRAARPRPNCAACSSRSSRWPPTSSAPTTARSSRRSATRCSSSPTTAVDGAEIALALLDAADDDDGCPQLRVGLAAGPVVSRLGDVFGQTVNIASRLTSIARPGSVLVDQGMSEALEDDDRYALKPLRPASVRGYHHLRSWRLRRASTGRSE